MNTKTNNLFWADDIDEVVKLIKRKFSKEEAYLIGLADDICNNTFLFRERWEMEKTNEPVHFGEKIVWDETPNGDHEWIFAFNRLSFLVVLGKAWRLTNNVAYSDAFVRIVNDWIDNVILDKDRKSDTWRTIETGIRSENFLRAIKLFENSIDFTDELRAKIEGSLKQHAEFLMENHDHWHRRSNWGILQSHGLFLIGVYFNDDTMKELAISRLVDGLPLQVFSDGVQIEQSPMYHCEVLHCCMDVLLIANKANVKLPSVYVEQVHKMATALALWNRPDGFLICQSDSDEIDSQDLLVLSAILFKDGEIKSYAGEQVVSETMWDLGSNAQHLYNEIYATGIRGSVALPDSGNYMLWDKKDKTADFLHFHCGYFGGGHGHADQLHIDLISNAETILADSGRYTYMDESQLREALKIASAHNTSIIDGKDFSEYKNSWAYSKTATPIKGNYLFTEQFDYVNGLHLGYLTLGIVAQRHVIRLGMGLWLIWDVFYAQDENATHKYDTFFHFGKEGVAELIHDGAVYHGKRCSAVVKSAKKDQQFSISREPISTEYNVLESSDCLKITSENKGTVGFATGIATGAANNVPLLSIEYIPVIEATTNKEFTTSTAQAVRIKNNKKEWTVIICHNEILSNSLLSAGNAIGFGKVLVFEGDNENGVCLSW